MRLAWVARRERSPPWTSALSWLRLRTVGETCAVALRRASVGSFYAAVTEGNDRLVARSLTFDPRDAAADKRARSEVASALRALGWRRLGGPGCRFGLSR